MDDSMGAKLRARELIRAGLNDLNAARGAFAKLADYGMDDARLPWMLDALSHACEPDIVLEHLTMILGNMNENQRVRFMADDGAMTRLVRVLGASDSMGKLMVGHPDLTEAAAFDKCSSFKFSRQERIDHMLSAIGANNTTDAAKNQGSGVSTPTSTAQEAANTSSAVTPGDLSAAANALRKSYYRQLAAIMAHDVESDNPIDIQPTISAKLSDLADASLNAALEIAKANVVDSERCRFAIIGMGKLGAQELNYVSDVDLIYVVEPEDGSKTDTATLTRIGTRIAMTMQKVCQSVVPGVTMPPLWQIDTALRPEGRDGPLVRTLASHQAYYDKWARNWEFQALLKARAVAGDRELGKAYEDMTRPLVWSASKRDDFVRECQRMRKRVEDTIEPELRDREIKLGKGGLRDVEFTAQMLQLVHGRSDESLRVRSTLGALEALAEGGYIARPQATKLGQDYRFERVLEHRQQMWQLKRTHLFPDIGTSDGEGLETKRKYDMRELNGNAELTRLARAFGLLPDELVKRYDETRREVRRLHVDIYYRPMLPINAQLDDDQVTLSHEASKERFAAIGFADPDAAMRHVDALTQGISRAAKINRILLPSILQWLAEGQNPDMGLLQWRKLEEHFGGSSSYLGFLRDSPQALTRLCHVLSNSRLLGDALNKSIESVRWLGDDAKLQARDRQSLDTQLASIAKRYATNVKDFATSVRELRRHEIERIGLAWTTGVMDGATSLTGMTDVYDAVIDAALSWAVRNQLRENKLEQAPATLCVIAMGRYGGREVNFCSDADAMIIYRPTQVKDGESRQAESPNSTVEPTGTAPISASVFAGKVVTDLRQILQGPVSVEAVIDLDLGLRPEGKNGPLVRSFDSYREYYTSWFSTWERQALLRARYAAGDQRLAEDFLTQVADPLRYMDRPLTEAEIGEIRTLKARMEAERLPRGVRRDRHLKLGAGGLSDVEWTVQLLQLEHAGEHRQLRTTSTLGALSELERLGYINHTDAKSLREAWQMLTDARNGNYLWGARMARADVLPDDLFSLGGVATFLGYGANRGQYFVNDMTAAMRRCREVMERLFYGQ
ncbi:bifunctional [glutamine synthetase] adenylyltransferase/[glutamine synthetase]-adenylyl-L-tyrosine phosphorylase [Bifidobacterium sp. ESL0790]|uniref:bifunctional [glutamine synthetase] adenylyltransferase/[glutamine synthetase]-adenylyl-L-tyrosine phosphorylase n=1 Tax=Bifidobacterium sp. ESL0790 TaxID=2983233 RepID=UPI0023F972A3|nr:bifunctional [glutamine synthetase] adenylyltransferase/[glutamine synthetase]-adenylyl-L-tyrosine phosphorylase [Bifidobacterium sp. ESL0790]WEV73138.1 bifunctional [glutamine synthetase] adenylyltransferase/[glutamine synthetase]-adenylyl-L-tyrosine phosphorylase [Bifidobacterium sp. ESL0790]